ncbi:MAG: APC family permease [Pirellula sp.]|jgi:amino acid transporter|nr:APC family permease [Pirellula sp.]
MQSDSNADTKLERGLGIWSATSLNIANMVGIGPFITIPLFIGTMNGPQAMIAWVLAAILVLCDGLIWAELGAALPGSGGSYHFLNETFGRMRWGRVVPFLFIWQFLVGGTLELASGYIGAMDYLRYAMPQLEGQIAGLGIPGGLNIVAALLCLSITFALCRNIRVVGWLSVVLCAGTLLTVLIVIVSGLFHFKASLITIPENAFDFNLAWFVALGAAMRIAVYDYLGYYNVCHLGEEVREPAKTIPRAILISVVAIAAIYLTMNICIIAVVPWQEAMASKNIAALFMETLYGRQVAVFFTWLIIWTALACTFAILLGYSRIPFAAARNGDFFPIFAKVHAEGKYPIYSLLALGSLTAVFCFLPLQLVIDAAVTVRILVQFVAQIFALHWLRRNRPEVSMPFRMWLYPIPSMIAFVGWIFLWSTSGTVVLVSGLGVLLSGVIAFAIWNRIREKTPQTVSH